MTISKPTLVALTLAVAVALVASGFALALSTDRPQSRTVTVQHERDPATRNCRPVPEHFEDRTFSPIPYC